MIFFQVLVGTFDGWKEPHQ